MIFVFFSATTSFMTSRQDFEYTHEEAASRLSSWNHGGEPVDSTQEVVNERLTEKRHSQATQNECGKDARTRPV